MRRNKRDTNRIVIQKITGYCDRIEELIYRFGGTFEAFRADIAFQLSCGMCIIQIGELTTRLTEDFKETHSDIQWNQVKALRNLHAHDYESVDLEIVWEILTEDIPELKERLEKLLSTAKEELT